MVSSNFTLLQEKTPQLYQIATFAEEYVYSDPQSSISKARLFAERITTILYKAYHIEVPQSSSFVDLLQNEKFKLYRAEIRDRQAKKEILDKNDIDINMQ